MRIIPATGRLRKTGAVLLAAAVAAGLGLWYWTNRVPPVPQRPLRIGFEQNPPVQIRTAGGFAGLAVETVAEAARRAGVSLQWVETGFSSEESLRKGLVDLWPLMADLPERRKHVHITRPWLHSTHALLTRAGSELPGRDFTGRIAFFRMPLHVRLLKEHFPQAQAIDFPEGEQAVQAVCAGSVGAAFLEGRAALTALRDKGSQCEQAPLRIHILGDTTIQLGLGSTFEAAGAAEKLRSEINDMFRDGTLAVTMARYSYYGLDDTWATYDLMEATERARWLSWGIAALIVALVFAVAQAFSLRRARHAAEAANAATSQALSRYELVAHATNDALFECDLRTGKVVWNDAVYVLFRYERGHVGDSLGWWEERVHPDDRGRVSESIRATIAREAPTWSGEYRFRRGDGSYASVVDRGYVLYERTKPVRLVRAIMDVTTQRTLEEQLRQSQKMEAIGRLAGGIAHDFNNLLTVIIGHSELRQKDADPAGPMHRALNEILNAGHRAAGLTQQLLAFSRKQMLRMEILDLNHVIAESAVVLRPLIGEAVELALDLHPALGLVRADAVQMHQVLLNLAINARDAMPAGGTLTVASANVTVEGFTSPEAPGVPPGSYVRISVTDTGSGISEEAQAHLFEPFFTTKEPGKGTGLGLSIVYGIVQQSGGYIGVSSRLGQGTAMRIYLPVIEGEVAAQEPKPDASSLRGNETILLVENEAPVRDLAEAVLKGFGYDVLVAEGPAEAMRVESARHGSIDILLTDVVMPAMTGCALADALLTGRPEMKVVYMSGHADSDIVREAMKRPGALFLQKPFTPSALAARLREAVHSVCPVVLVVDDDAPSRGFLRELLQEAGYYVVEAADGREAMARVRSCKVDLVFTDLVMPEQEGLETIRAMRQEFPDIRIVAMSGAFGGDMLRVAEHVGALATLRKPAAPSDVLRIVAQALSLPRPDSSGRSSPQLPLESG